MIASIKSINFPYHIAGTDWLKAFKKLEKYSFASASEENGNFRDRFEPYMPEGPRKPALPSLPLEPKLPHLDDPENWHALDDLHNHLRHHTLLFRLCLLTLPSQVFRPDCESSKNFIYYRIFFLYCRSYPRFLLFLRHLRIPHRPHCHHLLKFIAQT